MTTRAVPDSDPASEARRPGPWATLAMGPATGRTRGVTHLTLLAVSLAVTVAQFGARPELGILYDDAYIVLHNARVLIAGTDANYGDVPALTGATSAIHVLLVAGLLSVFEPMTALLASGAVGVILYVQALLHLAFSQRASVLEATLLLATGCLVGLTPLHLWNGLETGLALGGSVFALALAASDSRRSRAWLPVIGGLLPFLRPELLALSVPLVVARAWADHSGTRRELGRALARDMLVLAATALPLLLWYWISTGTPLPSTIAAKRAFFAESCLPAAARWDLVAGACWTYLATIGFAAAGYLMLAGSPAGRAAVLFTACFLAAYFAGLPGALHHYHNRYVYILVAPLMLALAVPLRSRGTFRAQLAVALLTLGACESGLGLHARWERHHAIAELARTNLGGVAEFLNETVQAGETVLVHDAGHASVFTDLRLVDVVGLKTPSSAPTHRAQTLPTCGAGRGAAVATVAATHAADYFVVSKEWEETFGLARELRALGWQLDAVRPPDEFFYAVYRLTPPETRGAGD